VVASLFLSPAIVLVINLLLDICDQGCLLHLLPKAITKISSHLTPHPLFSVSQKIKINKINNNNKNK
jgi:hypothetical protein